MNQIGFPRICIYFPIDLGYFYKKLQTAAESEAGPKLDRSWSEGANFNRQRD